MLQWQRPFANPQGPSYSFHDQHLVPLDKKGGVAVQSLICVWLFVTPRTAVCQASLCFTISQSLLKLMSTELVIPSSHLILCQPFSSCPQSFPASGSFPMSRLFESGGQSTGGSASESVLPMNIQDWLPLGLTGLVSLQSKELSSLPRHHSLKVSTLWRSAFFMV